MLWMWLACGPAEPVEWAAPAQGCADAWVDADGDGHPGGAACGALGADCDDTDAAVFPGAVEVCNGRDDDCDGLADDADPELAARRWVDGDGDGFGAAEAGYGCPTVGYVDQPGDCDDTNADVHPGAPERCDGAADNNCDGDLDPDEVDGDGDGDGRCSDCDDTDPRRSSRHQERCDGLDTDCDGLVDLDDPSVNPYTCEGYCPTEPHADVLAAATFKEVLYNPCVLDPSTTHLCMPDGSDQPTVGQRLHRVLVRTDDTNYRDQLFLFLPPGPGLFNDTFRRWAAMAGYRTISLGYANEGKMEDICAPLGDICYSDWRYEVTYGLDLSPHIDISASDSLVRRLEVLLQTLAAEDAALWGRYVDDDGRPVWNDIVISGWSIGSGHAAFLAAHEPAWGVFLLSGPKDRVNDPEPVPSAWLAGPKQTEGCRFVGAYHQTEHFVTPPHDVLYVAWSQLGITMPAFHLEDDVGTYADYPAITSSYDAGNDCDGHPTMADDACLPDDYFEPYRDRFCAVAEQRFCP